MMKSIKDELLKMSARLIEISNQLEKKTKSKTELENVIHLKTKKKSGLSAAFLFICSAQCFCDGAEAFNQLIG